MLTQPDILGMRKVEKGVTASKLRQAWGGAEARGVPPLPPRCPYRGLLSLGWAFWVLARSEVLPPPNTGPQGSWVLAGRKCAAEKW